MRVVAAATLLVGERQEPIAAGDGGKVLGPLRFAAPEPHCLGAEQDRREHRLRREAAAELLEDDHQLRVPEPGAAVPLRDEDAGPPEPRHLAPELAREAGRVTAVPQRAGVPCPGTGRGEVPPGPTAAVLLL